MYDRLGFASSNLNIAMGQLGVTLGWVSDESNETSLRRVHDESIRLTYTLGLRPVGPEAAPASYGGRAIFGLLVRGLCVRQC